MLTSSRLRSAWLAEVDHRGHLVFRLLGRLISRVLTHLNAIIMAACSRHFRCSGGLRPAVGGADLVSYGAWL